MSGPITSITISAEEELVSRIHAGDRDAECQLVARYSRGLMVMLRQRIDDFELAADVHQEAFAVVIARLREKPLDDPCRLSAFVRKTAVNLLIGIQRKEARRNTWADDDKICATADANAGPLATLKASELINLVRKALGRLSVPRDRELLTRYYLAEEDKRTICEDLGLNSAHFDRVVSRARQRMRRLLEARPETVGRDTQ